MAQQELKQTIGWEIKGENVFSGDVVGLEKIKGYKAISRDDNGSILSVMKNSYSPMTNAEFIDVLGNIQRISGFKFVGYNEFGGGKKILGFLENDRDDLLIGGHKMKNYMLLGNSFDGSTSFFTGTSTVLIRCQNQFSQIQKFTKIRHTKQIQGKLEEYYSYLDSFFAQREELKRTFEKAGNIFLTEKLQEEMINFVLDVKEVTDKELSARKQNQIEMLRSSIRGESSDLGWNLWSAFNGVTKYTTHELETKKASTFGNLFGIKADINNRAIQFVNDKLVLS